MSVYFIITIKVQIYFYNYNCGFIINTVRIYCIQFGKMQESVKQKTNFIHTQGKPVLNRNHLFLYVISFYIFEIILYVHVFISKFPFTYHLDLIGFTFFHYFLPAFFFLISFFLGNRNLTLFWNEFGYPDNKDMEKSSDSVQYQRRQAMAIPCMIQCGEC